MLLPTKSDYLKWDAPPLDIKKDVEDLLKIVKYGVDDYNKQKRWVILKQSAYYSDNNNGFVVRLKLKNKK